jgi:hypothetical protein
LKVVVKAKILTPIVVFALMENAFLLPILENLGILDVIQQLLRASITVVADAATESAYKLREESRAAA